VNTIRIEVIVRLTAILGTPAMLAAFGLAM
jgi:hypothetical protein